METEAVTQKKKERGPCGTPRTSRGKKTRTGVELKRAWKASANGAALKIFARAQATPLSTLWFKNKK